MITEDHLEQLTLTWFQETGWSYLPGPAIAPEAVSSERADYGAVVLKPRLAAATLARLERNIAESSTLAARRDALLPKLLGEELLVNAIYEGTLGGN